MSEECRGEIVLADGRVMPVERRSGDRARPDYAPAARKPGPDLAKDRRRHARPRDAATRGRLLDISG